MPQSHFLERQHLGGDFAGGVGELLEQLAGINAQSARAPSVGLWTRMAAFDQCELDAGLRSYSLVKASLMRGTVHLVTRRQFLTWRAALQPALERVVRGFLPRLWQRVDHDELLREGAAMVGASEGLTRGQMGDGLARLFPGADPRDLGFAMRTLGTFLQVPSRTAWEPGRTRYVLASSVLAEPLTAAEAGLPDLLSAYLRSFGPASAADAAYWSGLSRLGPALAAAATTDPGRSPRWPRYDVPACEQRPRHAYVLPEFDNIYFSAARLPDELVMAKKRLLYGAALMRGSLVVGGRVVGHWTAPKAAARPVLDRWTDLDAGAEAELERFAAWYARTSEAVRHAPT